METNSENVLSRPKKQFFKASLAPENVPASLREGTENVNMRMSPKVHAQKVKQVKILDMNFLNHSEVKSRKKSPAKHVT